MNKIRKSRVPKAPPSKPLTKTDVEARVKELREKFETESKNLEAYIKNSNATVDAKRAELAQMQGEYNGLMALLNNYNW